MPIKVAFFDAKSYDRESFDQENKDSGIEIHYYKDRLTSNSVSMSKGMDAVCIFVNAESNAQESTS